MSENLLTILTVNDVMSIMKFKNRLSAYRLMDEVGCFSTGDNPLKKHRRVEKLKLERYLEETSRAPQQKQYYIRKYTKK